MRQWRSFIGCIIFCSSSDSWLDISVRGLKMSFHVLRTDSAVHLASSTYIQGIYDRPQAPRDEVIFRDGEEKQLARIIASFDDAKIALGFGRSLSEIKCINNFLCSKALHEVSSGSLNFNPKLHICLDTEREVDSLIKSTEAAKGPFEPFLEGISNAIEPNTIIEKKSSDGNQSPFGTLREGSWAYCAAAVESLKSCIIFHQKESSDPEQKKKLVRLVDSFDLFESINMTPEDVCKRVGDAIGYYSVRKNFKQGALSGKGFVPQEYIKGVNGGGDYSDIGNFLDRESDGSGTSSDDSSPTQEIEF